MHTESCLCKQGHRAAQLQGHKRKQTAPSPQEPPLLCRLGRLLTAPSWPPGGQGILAPLPESAAPGRWSASSLLDQEARSCLRCSPKPALAPGEVSCEGSEARGQKNKPFTPKRISLVECSVPWWQAFCRDTLPLQQQASPPLPGDCACAHAHALHTYLKRSRLTG